jgi:hypothetical protein
MAEVLRFDAGDFSFIHAPKGPFSAGVAAAPGFALHRARFARPVPMAEGFSRIEAHLAAKGRPVTALAACELRSPKPMTWAEFQAFNAEYLVTLHAWGCRLGEINTPARSNIAPATEAPRETMFFAFTYTVPEAGAAGDYLISGKPESRDGATGADRTFGGRDVTLRGLEAKAEFVMDAMRERVAALGCDLAAATGAQIYSVHDPRPLLETAFAKAGLSQIGVACYPGWPPVVDMEIEFDVRRVRTELVI